MCSSVTQVYNIRFRKYVIYCIFSLYSLLILPPVATVGSLNSFPTHRPRHSRAKYVLRILLLYAQKSASVIRACANDEIRFLRNPRFLGSRDTPLRVVSRKTKIVIKTQSFLVCTKKVKSHFLWTYRGIQLSKLASPSLLEAPSSRGPPF